MSLITKEHSSLVLQIIKKLLSFKADKDEVILKDDISEYDAVVIALETDLLDGDIPTTEDGAVYTDKNGDIYVL